MNGHVPQRIEEPTTNRLVAGWNPAVPAINNAPLPALTDSRANQPADRAANRPSFALSAHCPPKGKAENDVPDLLYSDGQSRILRSKARATLEVPAMRKAIQ
jgi:hypothetical protein